VPYAFLENGRVTAQPTEDRGLLMFHGDDKDRHSRQGPAAPGFTGYEVLPTLTDKAIAYVGERADDAKAGKPFFLYLPYASPHTPILPNAEWRGKSGLNAYADFVMEQDHEVGRLLQALDQHGLSDNTVVVFTSDNGCSPQARYDELLAKGHNPSAHFRGHKADIYEGGHRVPFIVRWPARVKGGQTTHQLTCLTDFMATAAAITGAKLPEDAAEDSYSFLPALTGASEGIVRRSVVHHSIGGFFAIREGKWKLALCPGSGGWSEPRPGKEAKNAPPLQLFDLEADPGEQHNVAAAHEDIVKCLQMKLEELVANGRSTPGARQQNAVAVDLWKKK
jgi:arylsulfatase A